jgi:hypothetical protein
MNQLAVTWVEQMAMKYTNVFLNKLLPKLPTMAFLIRKSAIWQPCFSWKNMAGSTEAFSSFSALVNATGSQPSKV